MSGWTREAIERAYENAADEVVPVHNQFVSLYGYEPDGKDLASRTMYSPSFALATRRWARKNRPNDFVDPQPLI